MLVQELTTGQCLSVYLTNAGSCVETVKLRMMQITPHDSTGIVI